MDPQRAPRAPPAKTRKFRELVCSPAARRTRAVRGSCFPARALGRIRAEYNRAHPASAIRASAPARVHAELKARLGDACDAEDCWMAQLPKRERAYLTKSVFAPRQPASWTKNTSEWLSNFDILDVLAQYQDAHPEFKFLGPAPMDFDARAAASEGGCVSADLCHFSLAKMAAARKTKVGIVFNTDDHDEPGSHWVSMFIDLSARSIFYFDSAGGDTPPEIAAFVKRVQAQGAAMHPPLALAYRENGAHVHQKSNTECGMYALFFNVVMLTSEADGAPISHAARTRLFARGNISDGRMRAFRSIYFNPPAAAPSVGGRRR